MKTDEQFERESDFHDQWATETKVEEVEVEHGRQWKVHLRSGEPMLLSDDVADIERLVETIRSRASQAVTDPRPLSASSRGEATVSPRA